MMKWVLSYWYKFKKSKNWLQFFFLAWHDQKKGVVTPKLTMFQEAIDRINIFLYGDANSGKQSFWVGMFENGCGLFGRVTRKSAVSQEGID